MFVDRFELNSVLSKLKFSVGGDTREAITQDFMFTGDYIVAYNTKMVFIYPFESDFIGTVKANELYKIIDRIKDDSFNLRYENGGVTIEAESIKGRIMPSSDEGFDIIEFLSDEVRIPDVDSHEWQKLPRGFFRGLYLCLFSANTEEQNKFVSGIQIKNKYIVSTDGEARISRYAMQDTFEDNFILPVKPVKELTKYSMEIDRYIMGDSWVYFLSRDNGMMAAVRRIAGEYPDVNKLFKFSAAKMNFPSDEMLAAVDTAEIMTYDDDDYESKIKIIVEDDKIVCRGEKNVGWVEKEVIVDSSIDDEVEFYINPVFLKELLELSGNISYAEGKVYFTSKRFEHLVAVSL